MRGIGEGNGMAKQAVNEGQLNEVADLASTCREALAALECAETVETQADLIANLREARDALNMLVGDVDALITECVS